MFWPEQSDFQSGVRKQNNQLTLDFMQNKMDDFVKNQFLSQISSYGYQIFKVLDQIIWNFWRFFEKNQVNKKTQISNLNKRFVSEGISFRLEFTSNLATFFKLFAKQKKF